MFNADFWIIAGTASPVIALAAVVASGSIINLNWSIDRAMVEAIRAQGGKDTLVPQTSLRKAARFHVRLARLLAQANVLLQTVMLVVSMMSVSAKRNYLPHWPVIVVEGIGIMGLLATSSTISHAQNYRFRLEYVAGANARPE